MSCTTLFECQNLLQVLLIENNNLESSFLQLYIDITFRKDMLSTWQQAPLELQESAKIAYEQTLTESINISNAYEQIINLKHVLDHITHTLNSALIDPSNLNLNLVNINNLITNYNTIKTTFLKDFQKLLDA